jgi:hypothetical protein
MHTARPWPDTARRSAHTRSAGGRRQGAAGGRHLVGSKPAATAARSSLPETSTAPEPSARRWRMSAMLLLALTA